MVADLSSHILPSSAGDIACDLVEQTHSFLFCHIVNYSYFLHSILIENRVYKTIF